MITTLRRTASTVGLAVLGTVLLPAASFAASPAPAPVPNPAPAAPQNVQDKVNVVLGLLKYGGIIAVLAGLILAGIIMASGHDAGRGGRDGTARLWYVAGGAILIGSASSIAGFLLA